MVSQERKDEVWLFLTDPLGAMPPTTSSLLVRSITGAPYTNLPQCTTGCYTHLGNNKKAQELLDACPALMERRKLGATKYLPTEIFILRKCESILPGILTTVCKALNSFRYSGILQGKTTTEDGLGGQLC